jgi:hypothetical protein
MAKTPKLDKTIAEAIAIAVKEAVKEALATPAQASAEVKAAPKIEDYEFTNGKLDGDKAVKTLEQALVIGSTNPFGTTEYAVFEERLKIMNMASLQDMCRKANLPALGSFPELRQTLKTAFIQRMGSSSGLKPMPTPKNIKLNPNDPKHLKMMQALGMKM